MGLGFMGWGVIWSVSKGLLDDKGKGQGKGKGIGIRNGVGKWWCLGWVWWVGLGLGWGEASRD